MFIEPLVADNSKDGFTRNGQNVLVYHGEPDETDGRKSWWLSDRIVPKTGKFKTDPSRLTKKKWSAYCAFRDLDISETQPEMIERLRESSRPQESHKFNLLLQVHLQAMMRFR